MRFPTPVMPASAWHRHFAGYSYYDNEGINRRNYCTHSQCESVVVLGIVLKCGAVRRWADYFGKRFWLNYI